MAKKPASPAPPSATSTHPLAIGIIIAVVLALAGLVVLSLNRTSGPGTAATASVPRAAPAPAASKPATAPASAPPAVAEPAPQPRPEAAARSMKRPAAGPLPPLPMVGFQLPRPIATVQAVFEFAARHPDVLEYVPCFCGCERSGHRGNDDCFVKRRDEDGNVEWDPHGMS